MKEVGAAEPLFDKGKEEGDLNLAILYIRMSGRKRSTRWAKLPTHSARYERTSWSDNNKRALLRKECFYADGHLSGTATSERWDPNV